MCMGHRLHYKIQVVHCLFKFGIPHVNVKLSSSFTASIVEHKLL